MKFEDPLNLRAILPIAFYLPPEQAIDYLKAKGGKNVKLTKSGEELSAEAHDKAFTIAKVTSANILQTVLDYLNKAQTDGMSLNKFKESVETRLQESGWTELKPSRLTTVFNTNLQIAFAKGQYDKQALLAEKEGLIYWKFVQVQRKTKRDAHSKFHNKVFHFKDPIWKKIYPPCGHNCKCRVIPLSLKEVKAQGLKIEEGTTYSNYINENLKGFSISPLDAWTPDLTKYDDKIAKAIKTSIEPPKPALITENKPKNYTIPDKLVNDLKKFYGDDKDSLNQWNKGLMDQSEKYILKVPKATQTALNEYMSAGFIKINGFLRGLNKDKSAEKHANEIMKNDCDFELNDDIKLFRGESFIDGLPDHITNLQVGKNFKSKGFFSTTAAFDNCKPFGQFGNRDKESVFFVVKAKKGSKIGFGTTYEKEFIFKHDEEFIVEEIQDFNLKGKRKRVIVLSTI